MKPLNPNFHFTIKYRNSHIGGEFQYIHQNQDVVKISLRGLTQRKLSDKKSVHQQLEQTSFLVNYKGIWMIWDLDHGRPCPPQPTDPIVYTALREALGLAMI
jgi:hypothetical protein